MQPLENPEIMPHVFTLHTAGPDYLPLCCEALFNSDYGKRYFSTGIQVESFLHPGFEKQEVIYAANKDGFFVGFIWYTIHSSFHDFPFIQAIAVKPSFRSIGAGTYLMSHFEEEAFKSSQAVFALVSSDDARLIRFFKRLQYQPAGRMNHLLLPGVEETLLWKRRLVG